MMFSLWKPDGISISSKLFNKNIKVPMTKAEKLKLSYGWNEQWKVSS